VAVCPVDAVTHHGFDGQPFPAIPQGASLGAENVTAFLRSRRSVREFRDKVVPREVLENLLDIARYAPTGSNAQNVRFIAITDPQRIRALSRRITRWVPLLGRLARVPGMLALAGRNWGRDRLERYLAALDGFVESVERGGDPIFHNAPALIITHARKGNALGIENCSYATYQLALAAHAMGLGTCMIGFLTTASRYDSAVRRLAGIPRGHRMATALVVGYPVYRYRRLVPRKPPRARWVTGDQDGESD
jgi:nitroreductase